MAPSRLQPHPSHLDLVHPPETVRIQRYNAAQWGGGGTCACSRMLASWTSENLAISPIIYRKKYHASETFPATEASPGPSEIQLSVKVCVAVSINCGKNRLNKLMIR